MTRGGRRKGAGRHAKPEALKAKRVTIMLYDWEIVQVRQFIAWIRGKHVDSQRDDMYN